MGKNITTRIAALDGAVRNPAFAKGINRDVNKANANKILADIKTHGYRQKLSTFFRQRKSQLMAI